ncbi:hypothetical protein CHS0354_022880 [Potamilus streckersoni]|uniref:Uncharacterized protein n=1 Tax=Potamilus streckersoni TaxID=2493646 RepID=A0AAE0S250_9BIVA|nr:hypothetical protein CHS0354_022880 [Potamilus streckersoni]
MSQIRRLRWDRDQAIFVPVSIEKGEDSSSQVIFSPTLPGSATPAVHFHVLLNNIIMKTTVLYTMYTSVVLHSLYHSTLYHAYLELKTTCIILPCLYHTEQTEFLPQHGGVDPLNFQGNRHENNGCNQVQRIQNVQNRRGSGHFEIKNGGNPANMRRKPIEHQNSLLGMPPHFDHQNSFLGMPPHFKHQNSLLGMPPHLDDQNSLLGMQPHPNDTVPCNLNFGQNQQGGREMRKGSAKTNVSRREKKHDGAKQSQEPSSNRTQSDSGGKEGHLCNTLDEQTKGWIGHQGIRRGCGRERDQCGRRGGKSNEQIDAEIKRGSSNVDARASVEERSNRKPRKRRQRRKKAYNESYEKVTGIAIGASPPTARDATVSDTDDSTSSSSTFQNERRSQNKKTVDVLLSKFKDLGDQIATLKVSKSDLQMNFTLCSSENTKRSKIKSQEFEKSIGSLGEENNHPKESTQVQDIQIDIEGVWDESMYREPTEPPGEKEVFRYLIKEVGGPTSVKNIAGTKLFPKDFDILNWFRDHRRRFIFFETRDKNDQLIVPFYKEATFCFGYNNIGKYGSCDQISCLHAHICKDFVDGSCKKGQKCRFSHNFYDRINSGLISKLGLNIFSNEEIRLIYSQRFPHVCGNHTPTRSCHLPVCAYLHICKRNLLGRCVGESDCPLGHTFETDHNKTIIKAYHLSNMKETLVKKVIFICTLTSKEHIQQKGSLTHGSKESIKEERNMSPNRLNKIAKSRINFQKEQKRKPQSRHKASNDGRLGKDINIGSNDIFKTDLMTSEKEEESSYFPIKEYLPVEEMQIEDKLMVISSPPVRVYSLESKVVNTDTYIGGARPKGPRPMYRGSNEIETMLDSQDSILETDAAQSTPICDRYLVNKCKMVTCKCHHHDSIKLPYIWQIQMFNSWLTLDKLQMIDVERAYCNNESSYQTEVFYCGSNYNATIEFHMLDSLALVAAKNSGSPNFKIETRIRRLSTKSYAEGTKLSADDSFKTQWRWFYTNDFERWCLLEPEFLQFTLEQKFTIKSQDTYLFHRENYRVRYCIDFISMKQINMET